eukprot:TRINITY_DN3682_c0_g3_i1.p1 TRINITY_DN3682_c0_g3~~TRINITY_DN3682_c0_g3_i1.p1  ORF type:complete len:405 (+),score=72.99 TRINITY_DN3682_c0_g3_i1:97-1215(+)
MGGLAEDGDEPEPEPEPEPHMEMDLSVANSYDIQEEYNQMSVTPIATPFKSKFAKSVKNYTEGNTLLKSNARKKRKPNKTMQMEDNTPRRVGCYCTCKKFRINPLREFIRRYYDLERYREVLHFKTMDKTRSSEDGNVFIFPYGVVVFWNLSVDEELDMVAEMKPFYEEPLETPESDHFEYYYWDKPPKVKNDEFFLCQDDRDNDEKVKVAISHGIAQSIKLSVFEEEIDYLIEETRQYPEELASKGEISLTRVEIFKKMGDLWLQKNEVNLHSDILDTPEFFFENPPLLPLFEATIDYLDLEQRVSVLNSRLDVVGDMFNLLNEEVHSQHGTRLEWILIWVIIASVLLELLNLTLEGYYDIFIKSSTNCGN